MRPTVLWCYLGQVVKGISETGKKTVKVGVFSIKLGITQLLSKRTYRRYTIGKRRNPNDEDENEERTFDSVLQSEESGDLCTA